jgi:hypothetical protein
MQKYHEDVRRAVLKDRITDELGDRMKTYIADFKKQFLVEHGVVSEQDDEADAPAPSAEEISKAAHEQEAADQAATDAAVRG